MWDQSLRRESLRLMGVDARLAVRRENLPVPVVAADRRVAAEAARDLIDIRRRLGTEILEVVEPAHVDPGRVRVGARVQYVGERRRHGMSRVAGVQQLAERRRIRIVDGRVIRNDRRPDVEQARDEAARARLRFRETQLGEDLDVVRDLEVARAERARIASQAP